MTPGALVEEHAGVGGHALQGREAARGTRESGLEDWGWHDDSRADGTSLLRRDRLTGMKSFGARSRGLRLERMAASPRWAGEGFRNVHPIPPSLRDPAAPTPSLSELLCAGSPRYPEEPLVTLDPRVAWGSDARWSDAAALWHRDATQATARTKDRGPGWSGMRPGAHRGGRPAPFYPRSTAIPRGRTSRRSESGAGMLRVVSLSFSSLRLSIAAVQRWITAYARQGRHGPA